MALEYERMRNDRLSETNLCVGSIARNCGNTYGVAGSLLYFGEHDHIGTTVCTVGMASAEGRQIVIQLLLYLACSLGTCHVVPLMVTPEAMAIATCESGNTVDFGTYSIMARNHQTQDGGIWQFNDATYQWLNGYDHAELDSPKNQYDTFVYLWRGGSGWRHWASSKSCWDKWLVINDDDKAVMR